MERSLNTSIDMHVKFNCSEQKQQLLIRALLLCSTLNLEALALILQLPRSTIEQVSEGGTYFSSSHAKALIKLFLIRFADDISFMDDNECIDKNN